jgi:hypothetical protein
LFLLFDLAEFEMRSSNLSSSAVSSSIGFEGLGKGIMSDIGWSLASIPRRISLLARDCCVSATSVLCWIRSPPQFSQTSFGAAWQVVADQRVTTGPSPLRDGAAGLHLAIGRAGDMFFVRIWKNSPSGRMHVVTMLKKIVYDAFEK